MSSATTPADPVPAGALARNQAARRRRVIEATLALAGAGGFEAVQMRDVAAESGVALGTVYRYFESKERLLLEAYVEQVAELGARLRARPPAGETPADRVVDVLHRATANLLRHPQATEAMVRAMGSAQRTEADAVVRLTEEMTAIIVAAMHHPDGVGEATPREVAVARVLNQVWFSALIGWVVGADPPARIREDLEAATRLLVEG